MANASPFTTSNNNKKNMVAEDRKDYKMWLGNCEVGGVGYGKLWGVNVGGIEIGWGYRNWLRYKKWLYLAVSKVAGGKKVEGDIEMVWRYGGCRNCRWKLCALTSYLYKFLGSLWSQGL